MSVPLEELRTLSFDEEKKRWTLAADRLAATGRLSGTASLQHGRLLLAPMVAGATGDDPAKSPKGAATVNVARTDAGLSYRATPAVALGLRHQLTVQRATGGSAGGASGAEAAGGGGALVGDYDAHVILLSVVAAWPARDPDLEVVAP